MKLNRTYILIIVSSVALAMLLLIQVSWIFQNARVKEELFNEKANMVLSKTAEALCSDKETCRNMGRYCILDSSIECRLKLGDNEVRKIDDLLRKYMHFYNFHIDYSFEVIMPGVQVAFKPEEKKNRNIFRQRIDEVAFKNGLELKLILPEKTKFIRDELGSLFVTSLVLIMVVLVLFWKTIRSLIREKKIAAHTTDFINNMTHEFKTPLTNIALAGKMILKESNIHEAEKIRQYMGIILDEKEKLRLQVEQVLSMSALERDDLPLLKTEVDFHQLINEAVKCIGIQIENKKGVLKLEMEAARTVIYGDKNHLINMLYNLIDNAIKYAKEIPDIYIHTSNNDHNLIFTISDQGKGIEKEYQTQVFDPFFRVPTGNTHDVKGFGLGLAYVKKIVMLHQGNIELYSEEGKGTQFILTLPLVHNE
ncbi:MAG: HAMP domain-containing sensor histidine kinase [Bacteroidota bacterium]|nr:HAMP domain-containing sensor histidine kinase [Bacteroidota bacterium]